MAGFRFHKRLLIALVAVAFCVVASSPAQGEMRTKQLSDHLCKVIGGGKFVEIPGFPGERIDRRLIPDIRWMKRRYDIFITDGYALSGHSPNGEHPIGLATDIVPYWSRGGNWDKITALAKRFEPEQNVVKMPFRWIGYNGDAGHGRGDHLHLSWSHSDPDRRNGHPERVVYTRICPGGGDTSGDGGGEPTDGGGDGSGGGDPSGGVEPKAASSGDGLSAAERAKLAPIVVEHE